MARPQRQHHALHAAKDQTLDNEGRATNMVAVSRTGSPPPNKTAAIGGLGPSRWAPARSARTAPRPETASVRGLFGHHGDPSMYRQVLGKVAVQPTGHHLLWVPDSGRMGSDGLAAANADLGCSGVLPSYLA